MVEIGAEKPPWSAVKLAERSGIVATLEWSVFATLAIFIVLGLGLRVSRLGRIGFAEDEMNKWTPSRPTVVETSPPMPSIL